MLFARAILAGEPIKVSNNGNAAGFHLHRRHRQGLLRSCDKPPTANAASDPLQPDLTTTAAPHRVFNIGNSQPTELLRFIEVMEQALCREAIKVFQPMQPGDVVATAADTQALKDWVDFQPFTPIEVGIQSFSDWYEAL